MRFLQVRLDAPARSLSALVDFYAERLGIELIERGDEQLALRIGETRLDFVAGAGLPFYHFALLAPGNRFEEVLAWAADRTELLPDSESGEVVFDFDAWGALACYFHDPAGNIVELIAHGGVGETGAEGRFTAQELIGFSELGLVGNPAHMAALLRRELGLELWQGTLEEEGRLAFVGEPARTLILSPERRPWLPTGRPAEAHPCTVLLSGLVDGESLLSNSRYRIRRVADPAG